MAPAPVKIGLPVGVGAVWTPVEATVLLATPEVTELGRAVLEHSKTVTVLDDVSRLNRRLKASMRLEGH